MRNDFSCALHFSDNALSSLFACKILNFSLRSVSHGTRISELARGLHANNVFLHEDRDFGILNDDPIQLNYSMTRFVFCACSMHVLIKIDRPQHLSIMYSLTHPKGPSHQDRCPHALSYPAPRITPTCNKNFGRCTCASNQTCTSLNDACMAGL